ncbi:MAG TPA: hypothetical protein VF824_10580 [Thermoanaerobaculia bacterium]|jgi:hypothetical protein
MKRDRIDWPPSVPLVMLTDVETGHRVAISGMWLTHFSEGDSGTLVKFTNGDTVTVEEDFMTLANAFSGRLR